MDERKNYYHIEVEREKASAIWSLLTEHFNMIIISRQHSLDGKDLNIHIRIIDKKK